MTVPAEPRASRVLLCGIAVSLVLFVECVGDEQKMPDEATILPVENATDSGSASLAKIAGIANGFERNAALYELVAEADRLRVEALLAEVSALPATHHRDDVARILYIRFAALDPSAAAAHAVRSLAKPYVLTAIFRAWAHEDLDAAVERAASLPAGAKPDAARAILQLDLLAAADREAIAARLGTRSAITEVKEAVEETDAPKVAEPYDRALARIAAITHGPRRRRETIDVASAWAATDPAGAMHGVFNSNVDPGLKNHALSLIMHSWASADPHAAIDWVLSRDPAKVADLAFTAYSILAEADLAAAQALVASLPEGVSKRQARMSVFVAIVNQGDLDRSLTAFTALDPSDQVWVVGGLGQQMGRAAPRRAFEWLLGLDKQVMKETLHETLMPIYQRDPGLIRELIQHVADPEFRIEAARYVAWESSDEVATLRWVESLGSEEEYAPVLAEVFRGWMNRSAEEATTALLRYPRGPGRDHALRRLVDERLSEFDTRRAERFFEAIDSPEERRLAAQRLHRYYTEVDPNERKAMEFEQVVLPDEG